MLIGHDDRDKAIRESLINDPSNASWGRVSETPAQLSSGSEFLNADAEHLSISYAFSEFRSKFSHSKMLFFLAVG